MTIDRNRRRFLRTTAALPIAHAVGFAALGGASVAFAFSPATDPVVDRYGTPHSDALHVVERYRLIGGEEAAAAIRKHRREFTTAAAIPRFNIYGAEFDNDMSKQGLQVEVTVEDPKMFTTPWKGFVTYRPATNWPEMTCAESMTTSAGVEGHLPTANKPDF